MAAPTPRPGILDITPYVPGGAHAPGARKVFKLSSNESALGPSPNAVEAYKAAAGILHEYPDGAASDLRAAIGAAYGLDPSRIVCGAGSDELLQLLARAFLGPGDNAVQTQYGFLVYAIATKACGAEIRYAPEPMLIANVDAILATVDEATRIVFLANPNNPTGTYIPASEMRRLRESLRPDVLLVLDAAYAEYMDAPDYEPGAALVDESDNVVMTRTFSKIYGLASLRLGWAYCPPAIADILNRIRGPFNVSAPALAAGAAAVADHAFVRRNCAHNRRERDWLAQQLGRLGLPFQPSAANFILARFPDEPGRTAKDVAARLKADGVIVREMDAYGLPDRLRISIGPAEANRRFIELLSEMFAP